LGTAVATLGSAIVQAEVQAVQHARKRTKRRVMGLFEGMPKAIQKFRKTKKTSSEYLSSLEVDTVSRRTSQNKIALLREVILRIMPALFIIIIGALVMSYLNGSTWTWTDSVYYGIVTGEFY